MGAASAVLLAQKGMAVTLAARSGPSLASLEKQIRKTGGEASVCQTDVTQRDNIEQMIQHTQQKYGRIDLLLYATGTNIPDRALPDLRPQDGRPRGDDVLVALPCQRGESRPRRPRTSRSATSWREAKELMKSWPPFTDMTWANNFPQEGQPWQ